jgi:hypothetical protein
MKVYNNVLSEHPHKSLVLEDAFELWIEEPNTSGKFIIRMHRDGRLVILSPQDEGIRRMFIEPIDQFGFLVQCFMPEGEK